MTAPEITTVSANGLSFCVETRGNPEGEPVIFIMGLGAQMTLWPESLLDAYAREGFRVIRFDNRDIGLSSHLRDRLEGHPLAVMARHRLGLSVDGPYSLYDMAADVRGLMEVMGIEQAHLVGVSMGGMIAQLVAASWPQQVRSLLLIMTSTNSPRLPMPKPELLWRLAGIGAKGHDEASVVDRGAAFWRAIQSPGYPAREDDIRARISNDFHRSYHPAGILRQTRAILASGSLSASTRRIEQPTTIVHGTHDPLVRPEAAKQLKYLMPHAHLELVEGMGHDLPEALVPRFAMLGMGMAADSRR